MVRMKKRLLLVCPALLVASTAWGAGVCTTTTLNIYDASGFSCTLGGLTFSNFTFLAPGGSPADTGVLLTPVNSGANVGFNVSGSFSAAPGTSADAVLGYTV